VRKEFDTNHGLTPVFYSNMIDKLGDTVDKSKGDGQGETGYSAGLLIPSDTSYVER